MLEIGVSLHEANDPVYLYQNTWTLYDDEIKSKLPLTEEIKRLTGIRDEALSEFGVHPTSAFRELAALCIERRVDYIVAHNGDNFDKPFLRAEFDKFGVSEPRFWEIPWLDTRKDIKYLPGEEPKQRSLEHLLMKKRFIPAISHRALADAVNTMWLLSHYDIAEIIEYHKIPWKVVQLKVHFEEKDLAKQNGFSWQELNHKQYPKSWVKLVKQNEIVAESAKYPNHALVVLE